ncbi:hypothetical protein BDQ17DRAFT_1375822 [Cyathus striatus]|nr:hypothetical protein BDQ17DRAFT_1375822 [Cyathus striatus]
MSCACASWITAIFFLVGNLDVLCGPVMLSSIHSFSIHVLFPMHNGTIFLFISISI